MAAHCQIRSRLLRPKMWMWMWSCAYGKKVCVVLHSQLLSQRIYAMPSREAGEQQKFTLLRFNLRIQARIALASGTSALLPRKEEKEQLVIFSILAKVEMTKVKAFYLCRTYCHVKATETLAPSTRPCYVLPRPLHGFSPGGFNSQPSSLSSLRKAPTSVRLSSSARPAKKIPLCSIRICPRRKVLL